MCLGVSLGCLEGVLGVIKTYRLTKSKMAVEVIWRVPEECLGGLSGGCLGVSGGCLAVSRGCVEGVLREFKYLWTHNTQNIASMIKTPIFSQCPQITKIA